jgi:hypothetical protein
MSGPCEGVLLLPGLKPHRELCGKSMGNIANCSFRTKSIRTGPSCWQETISNSFVTFRHQPMRAVVSPFRCVRQPRGKWRKISLDTRLRIYDYALTADQIAAHYATGTGN